jgi:DNA modification methylase
MPGSEVCVPSGVQADGSISTWELEHGTLAWADCLTWFPALSKQSIRLIAIDPPFFTGAPKKGSGAEGPVYSDRWEGGLNAYVDWLLERIALMRDLLLPDGSFLIHLDWHAVHYVKVALDGLFGKYCFQNEIIWYYQTGGAGKSRFSRKHDTLLWYTRSQKWSFYPERIRVHRSPQALARARNPKGARIHFENEDKLPGDVLFVPALNPMAQERTGYPTQKPIELLALFIEAMTDPGETVADFFCGSGTTLVAAEQLGRRWLGCDSSRQAISIAQQRLSAIEAIPQQSLFSENPE